MKIDVLKIDSEETLEAAFKIRQTVFVLEQKVAPEEEYDEFEEISTHFLARADGVPAGTARWRITHQGVKLERFAVLEPMRKLGVGQALVKTVLEDIQNDGNAKGRLVYLHAQLPAVSLYAKFGFEKEGKIFKECGISHYTMKKYS